MLRRRQSFSLVITTLFVAMALVAGYQAFAHAQDDPVVTKIVQLGKTDPHVMTWLDFESNRFGGRETGTNAYNDATEWAVWQLKQFGLEARLEEAGQLPVGFNRGPWFGRMTKPAEKLLRFGTPSFTAGTKGVQRGGVVILKADPFSIPGRAQGGQPVARENVEKKRAAVEAAIAEINANKAAFRDKWVLIAGASTGFARDGRRGTKLADGSPEYLDAEMMPPLTKALIDAGALGTIQSAKPTATIPRTTRQPGAGGGPMAPLGQSPAAPPAAGSPLLPLSMLDGYAESWDKLPVLPDIKLLDSQYDEIRAAVEKNQPVELEFDIRNWFKMGPIKYHNVVATLKGTTYPDEYIVIGGHFDCFSSGTGGVDDGTGSSRMMEVMRLLTSSGAKPKRSIMVILFAAEESGLVGSQAWLKNHVGVDKKVVMMINHDHNPAAAGGATVPAAWYGDFEKILAPMQAYDSKFKFELRKDEYPRPRPETPGGSDSSSFMMAGVPVLGLAESTDYNYQWAWHTLNDLYSEVVPYAAHQEQAAVATAIAAYGAANLDKPLTRAGIYLPDGLYADITTAKGRIVMSLDYAHAPVHTANFIRIVEGKDGPPAGGGRAAMGPGGPERGASPAAPPVGKVVDVRKGTINGVITPDAKKAVALASLPKMPNTALKHDEAGVLGIAGPNTFYLTLEKQPRLDRRTTAIGKVIAGMSVMKELKKDDAISTVRIVRVGQAAKDFKVDDESFRKLQEAAKKK